MKNWMLYIIFLSSPISANCCGWWPTGEELRFSLFSSHLGASPDAYPLFYNTQYFNDYKVDAYYGPTENLNEWYDYFNQEVSKEEIDNLIYSYPVYKGFKGIEENMLMKRFKSGKNLEASQYIFYAKSIEEKLDWSPWKDEEIDVLGLEQLAKHGETKMNQTNDQYLKLRYAYQLVVIYYYLNDPDKSLYYHNNFVMTSAQESVIKSWSGFYQANNTSGRINRLYELSKIFNSCKSKTKFIYNAFSHEKEEYLQVLAKCKNDEEKATVLSIQAFKNPGRALDQIKKIVTLDPSSDLIDLLLIREINKMEDWYFSEYYSSYGSGIEQNCWHCDAFKFVQDKNFQSDKAYLKSVLAYSKLITVSEKNLNRAIWFTSIAYMNFMLDDAGETEKYLKLAKGNAPTEKVSGQILMIDLLSLVKNEDGWGEEFQQNLMNKLIEVDRFKDEIYRYSRFKSELMLAISRRYLEKDEVLLAALFESKVKGQITERHNYWDRNGGYQAFDLLNENADSEDLDELFELWYKPNKTVLEKFLLTDLKPFKWRLTDLWATQYFREDNLEKALEIYETIPDSVWTTVDDRLHYYYLYELDNDPFETNIYGKSYGVEAEFTYTKPEFIKEILRLKKNIEEGKDKAHSAFLLGNAYYNMTANGNSYYYTEYSLGGHRDDEIRRNRDNFWYPHQAMKYYEMAEEFSTKKPYAAFCHRMQLKCKYELLSIVNDWKEVQKKSEKEWSNFLSLYPNDAPKLFGCDYLYYYGNSWK